MVKFSRDRYSLSEPCTPRARISQRRAWIFNARPVIARGLNFLHQVMVEVVEPVDRCSAGAPSASIRIAWDYKLRPSNKQGYTELATPTSNGKKVRLSSNNTVSLWINEGTWSCFNIWDFMRGVVEFPMTFVARLYSSACTPSTAWPYLKLYCVHAAHTIIFC